LDDADLAISSRKMLGHKSHFPGSSRRWFHEQDSAARAGRPVALLLASLELGYLLVSQFLEIALLEDGPALVQSPLHSLPFQEDVLLTRRLVLGVTLVLGVDDGRQGAGSHPRG
jgi:hypothetical protein